MLPPALPAIAEPFRVFAPAPPPPEAPRPEALPSPFAPERRRPRTVEEAFVPAEMRREERPFEPERAFAPFAPEEERRAAATEKPPRREEPSRRPAEARAPAWQILRRRPAGPPFWTAPTIDDFSRRIEQTFPLNDMFAYIEGERRRPEFQKELSQLAKRGLPIEIPLEPLTTKEVYTDLSSFFGIPWAVFERYLGEKPTREEAEQAEGQLWFDVLYPMFDILGVAFDRFKPETLPGWFTVKELKPGTGEWWLVYQETQFPSAPK
jgi:hypothetical protein